MKENPIIDALNDIKDEYILEAREEKKPFSFKSYIKPISILAVCACICVFCLPFSGMRSKSVNYDTYYEDSYVEESNETYDTKTKEKVIVNSSLSMEVKNLDEVIKDIEKDIESYNGYIKSSSISTYDSSREYYVTICVPSESYDDFVQAIQEKGNTTHYSKSQDDVTDTYVDYESRLESLKTEEKRVLEFYEEAETVDELITVEQRLTEIQQEISYIESMLNNLDESTTYSTISLSVRETTTFSANGNFISRIQYALSNGWQNFIYNVEGIIEFLAYHWVIVVIVLVVVGIIKFKKK